MSRARFLAVVALAALAACNSNTAPGNDTESQLDPAPTPVPVMRAGEALSGIATEAVQPDIMSDADVAAIGGLAGKCAFRFTEVDHPAFVADSGGGVIKLNAKLIPLPRTGERSYADGGLQVVFRRIDEELGRGGRREAELVVRLPGAKDELGFRGYETCTAGPREGAA